MGKKNKDSDVELLKTLATLDDVEARIPTSMEADQGIVPPWCELVLTLKRYDNDGMKPPWPINTTLPLRRHDGELIIEVLHNVLHTESGLSVAMGLWMDLDQVMDRLMKRSSKGKKPKPRDVGLATGLTIALARLINPFQIDEEAVKATAYERWERRHSA